MKRLFVCNKAGTKVICRQCRLAFPLTIQQMMYNCDDLVCEDAYMIRHRHPFEVAVLRQIAVARNAKYTGINAVDIADAVMAILWRVLKEGRK